MNKYKVITVSVVLGLVLLLVVVYRFFGLREYFRAVDIINNLPSDQNGFTRSSLLRSIDDYSYSGIVALFLQGDPSTIYIWSRDGLKKFVLDQYSIFSIFRACGEETLNELASKGNFSVERSITKDIQLFSTYAVPGSYILITLSGEESGGVVGNLREASIYDWWIFDPTSARFQCVR